MLSQAEQERNKPWHMAEDPDDPFRSFVKFFLLLGFFSPARIPGHEPPDDNHGHNLAMSTDHSNEYYFVQNVNSGA